MNERNYIMSTRKNTSYVHFAYILSVLLFECLCIAGVEWNGLGSDNLWSNTANWNSLSIPTSTDLVLIKGQTASGDQSPEISRPVKASALGIYIGYNSTTLPAELRITGGKLLAGGNGISIGFVADGKITLSSGSIEGDIYLGRGNEWGYGTGILEITGGIIKTKKISFGMYNPGYLGGKGHIHLIDGFLDAENILNLQTPQSFIDIEQGQLILNGDRRNDIEAWVNSGFITAYAGLGQIQISFDTTYPGKTLVEAKDTTRQCKPLKWWDNFPRIVSTSNVQTALAYNANISITSAQQDPGWGLYGQKVGESPSLTQAFNAAGIKSIGYYETLGQAYCYVAELSTPSKSTEYRTIEHQHWTWAGYSGGAIKWIGLHNFFDDEYFARPWTRTDNLYGGEQMKYPNGSIASGYTISSSDPRSSRIYDAGFAKNVLGNLHADYNYNEVVNADNGSGSPTGPIAGLLYIPEDDKYSGMLLFAKDPLCPYFDSFQYSSVNYAAGKGMQGMWSDNYGPWDSLNMKPVTRAFGDWSIHKFNEYLAKTFSPQQLLSMGVANTAAFDIAVYLQGKVSEWGGNPANLNDGKWTDSRWQDDPLWQAFLIFKRQTGTAALSQYYQTTKRAAADGGQTDFAILGNDIPGFSLGWARGSLDMVSTEMNAGWSLCAGSRGFMLPPLGRFAPAYKAAREHARSRFVNVWFYNDHYEDYLKHLPPQYYANPAVIWVLYSEMLATHTLPKISDGNTRNTGSPQINSEFFDFVKLIEPQFGHRTAVEEIGVYYSSSSIVNQLLPGGIKDFDSQPHQFAVWGWATAVEQLHYQFRILPEWKLTSENLAKLKLFIVPESIIFESSKVAILQSWVQQGGRLIVTGASGKRNGEENNFALYTNGYSLLPLTGIADMSNAPSEKITTIGNGRVLYIKDNIGLDFFVNESSRSTSLGAIAGYLDTAAEGCEMLLTPVSGLAPDISLTVYEDICDGKYFIDAVNFDIDLETDTINPTGEIKFRLILPEWMVGQDISIRAVSPKSSPAVSYIKTSADVVEITLGSFTYYASTIIEIADTSDIYADGITNLADMATLAEQWNSIEGGCFALNDWCNSSDIDKNNSVETNDLLLIAADWLEN